MVHRLIILPKAKKALAADLDALSETEQNVILKGKAGKRTRSTVDGDGKENVCYISFCLAECSYNLSRLLALQRRKSLDDRRRANQL